MDAVQVASKNFVFLPHRSSFNLLDPIRYANVAESRKSNSNNNKQDAFLRKKAGDGGNSSHNGALRNGGGSGGENEQKTLPSAPAPKALLPNLKMFTFAELRSATRNFRPDTVLGEGGFGRVFKGWVEEGTYKPSRVGVGIPVAVKKSSPDSPQGLQEWQVHLYPSILNYQLDGVSSNMMGADLFIFNLKAWRDRDVLFLVFFFLKSQNMN